MFSLPPLDQLTASGNLHCHRRHCCRQASLAVLSLSFPFDMAAASRLSVPLNWTFPLVEKSEWRINMYDVAITIGHTFIDIGDVFGLLVSRQQCRDLWVGFRKRKVDKIM